MMFMTSETFGAGRRLSMMARLAPRRLEKARARSTPPASGDTTTGRSPLKPSVRSSSISTGIANR